MHIDHRVGPVARDERVTGLADDADLVEPRGAAEELTYPVLVCPVAGADESELPHRHEVAALKRSRLLHRPDDRDAEDLPEEPGEPGFPGPLPFCRPGDNKTAVGHRLLVAHEVEVCKRLLPQYPDIHPSPPHLDDRVQEKEREEVLRIQGIGVLRHAPAGLLHLPLPAPEGDGLVCQINESPAHRRVVVGGIEDRLLEPEHPDPELLPEGAFEVIVLPARFVAAERPLVKCRIRLQQPEKHLDPRTVDDNLPEGVPLRPHSRCHPAHRPRRGAAKKYAIITPTAVATASSQFTLPPTAKLIPAKTANASTP